MYLDYPLSIDPTLYHDRQLVRNPSDVTQINCKRRIPLIATAVTGKSLDLLGKCLISMYL
jgi:hypothetical protein